jgi:hypothetical protein
MTTPEAAWKGRRDLEALNEYRLCRVLNEGPNISTTPKRFSLTFFQGLCIIILTVAVLVWL